MMAFFLLFILSVFSQAAQISAGQSFENEIFKNISTDSKKDPNSEETLSSLSKDVDYNVTGSYSSYISSRCHYSELQKRIHEGSLLNSQLASSLQSWISTCEAELSRFQTSSLSSLLNYYLAKYPLSKNPKFQNVVFQYDESLKVRGILALKDSRKRPLVIIRNGVYGNAEDSAVSRNLLMQVFDESPFHVLFLGNITGDQYIKDNGLLAMGGFDEGRQFHEVIRQLTAQNSAYLPYIEDIHIIGVSLGGNGALFSSLYNSYLPEASYKVKSVVALCPVVNLENSLNTVFDKTTLGKIYFLISYNLLKSIFQFVPILSQFLKSDEMWSQSEVTRAVKNSSIQNYMQRTQKNPWDYAPFNGVQIQSEKEFWDLNNFINYADQIRTPTLVVHARDDFIVESKKNSDLLYEKIKDKDSEIGILKFQNGSHCAYNIANGWPTISTLLRDYILKHSNYKQESAPYISPLSYLKSPVSSANLIFARYNWIYKKNKETVSLKITYLNKNNRDEQSRGTCRAADYRFAKSGFCYTTKEYEVSLSTFSQLNIYKTASEFEANLLSRWLNTHVSPVTVNRLLPYGTSQVPTHFISSGEFR